MLLGTLGASLAGNRAIATSQGVNRVNRAVEEAVAKSISEETKSKRQGREIVRAIYGNKKVWKTTKNKKIF